MSLYLSRWNTVTDGSFCVLLCFPPTAEKWSFTPPAPRCAAFGQLSSSRGQQPSSEPQPGHSESPKAKAEVTGEMSECEREIKSCWCWAGHGPFGALEDCCWGIRSQRSSGSHAAHSASDCELVSHELFFPEDVGLNLKWAVHAYASVHLESSLGLIGVKEAAVFPTGSCETVVCGLQILLKGPSGMSYRYSFMHLKS